MNDDIKLYELYDVIYEPWWTKSWFIVPMACIVILAVGYGLYYFYNRFLRKKIFQTPAQRFSQVLDQLSAQVAAGSIEPKQFYFCLTHELKYYFGKQFEVNLLDKTDYELIDALQKTSFGREYIHELKKILDNAVMVKFAQEQIDRAMQLKDVAFCKKQVELNQAGANKA